LSNKDIFKQQIKKEKVVDMLLSESSIKIKRRCKKESSQEKLFMIVDGS